MTLSSWTAGTSGMYLFVSLDLKPIAVELRADRYASYPAKPELSVTSPESETINSATIPIYIYIYQLTRSPPLTKLAEQPLIAELFSSRSERGT